MLKNKFYREVFMPVKKLQEDLGKGTYKLSVRKTIFMTELLNLLQES
jgi:hypothetical protein